jgi:hypothetical protein
MAKTERIEARLSAEQDELVRWAASIQGVGVSTFLVQSAVERARQMQLHEPPPWCHASVKRSFAHGSRNPPSRRTR